MMCDLSVILVNWNTGSELLNTLDTLCESLAKLPESRVILVDNASTDGSAQAAAQKFPQLKVIYNSANLGFGAANNIGFAEARGDYVLLVNPDLQMTPAALQTMLNFMEAHPQAGICGPKVLEAGGTVINPWCARRDPKPRDIFFEYSFLYRLFPHHHCFARYVMGDWDHSCDRQVDALSGACMLVRSKVIKQTNGFDEQFFMYVEDLDWCRRIRLAGWQVWFVAGAHATHTGGHSTKQTSDHGSRWGLESHLRYFHKWGGSADVFKLRIVLSIGCVIRAAAWLGMPVLHPRQLQHTLSRSTEYLYESLLAWIMSCAFSSSTIISIRVDPRRTGWAWPRN